MFTILLQFPTPLTWQCGTCPFCPLQTSIVFIRLLFSGVAIHTLC